MQLLGSALVFGLGDSGSNPSGRENFSTFIFVVQMFHLILDQFIWRSNNDTFNFSLIQFGFALFAKFKILNRHYKSNQEARQANKYISKLKII